MKKTLLPLVTLSLLALSIQAQVLSFSPSNVLDAPFSGVNLTVSNDLEVYLAVTNITNEVLDLKWIREVPSSCSSIWESQVCDNNYCYLEHISTNYDPANGYLDIFTLKANETFDEFVFHVKPGDQPGCCPYMIHFFDINNWDDTLATLHINVSVNTPDCTFIVSDAKEQQEAANIKVFPNPTANAFSLTENEVIKQVSIFNILGRQVKTFQSNSNQQYDIADLANGLYLVGMMNQNGEVLKTVRLFKQAVRP